MRTLSKHIQRGLLEEFPPKSITIMEINHADYNLLMAVLGINHHHGNASITDDFLCCLAVIHKQILLLRDYNKRAVLPLLTESCRLQICRLTLPFLNSSGVF